MCGGGPDPDDFNKPTEIEQANTEVAVKHYNHYISELKPAIDAYMGDIKGDVTPRAEIARGMANADIMQEAAKRTPIDPTRGLSVDSVVNTADKASKAGLAVETGAQAQQAAGLQSLLDAGQGKESMAQTGLSDLAQQSVGNQIKDAEAEYNSSTSTTRSIMGGAGMAAGLFYNNKVQPAKNGMTV